MNKFKRGDIIRGTSGKHYEVIKELIPPFGEFNYLVYDLHNDLTRVDESTNKVKGNMCDLFKRYIIKSNKPGWF